jgi:UDP-N-acetylmuramoylalanine--D-glutamate ligase
MIPVAGFEGQKVMVLGLGRSGLSAARALQAGGAEVLCWDDGAAGRAAAEAEGLTLHDPMGRARFDGVACLVTSPGIPHLYPAPHRAIAAAMAEGIPVDNDIGLFFRSLGQGEWARHDTPPRVVAVTGTNGKSTTAALIAHVLEEAGTPMALAGNIGRGVLDLDPPGDGAVIVLELSSYQTELARALTPDIAVFTNLTPDHLDRHGGMGGYFAAKRRLFAEGGPDRAIIGVDEAEGRFLANQLAEGPGDERLIRVSAGKLSGAGLGHLHAQGLALGMAQGAADRVDRPARDAGAAGGAQPPERGLRLCGGPRAGPVAQADRGRLASFTGLPHRSQRVAEIGGVAYRQRQQGDECGCGGQGALGLPAHPLDLRRAGEGRRDGGAGGGHGNVAKAYVIGREAEAFALALGDVPHEVCGDMATRRRARRGGGGAGRHGPSGARGGELRPVRQFRETRRGFHRAGGETVRLSETCYPDGVQSTEERPWPR